MAWTTPRTWSSGETVTAALLNTHVRDNLNWLYAPAYVHLRRNATQSINNTTQTAINWDTEVEDASGFHSGTSANVTVPTGYGGIYVMDVSVTFAVDVDGARSIFLMVNGTGVAVGDGVGNGNATAGHRPSTGISYRLDAGDVVSVEVFHNAGAALDINGGRLTLARVGG